MAIMTATHRRGGSASSAGKGLRHIPHMVAVLASLLVVVTCLPGILGADCDQDEFTKCAEPLEMLHLTSEFSLGTAKKEELDKLCHELRKGVRCIQSYTRRCMDLQQRNQFNKLYHGTNQFIRDLCNHGEFQDEYLKHAPCAEMANKEFEVCANRYRQTMVFLQTIDNKNNNNNNNDNNLQSHQHRQHHHQHYYHDQQQHEHDPQPDIHQHDDAKAAAAAASENETLNENIKTICCAIHELVDCSEWAARRICGNEAAKFTRELVDKYAYSLTKLYCEDFTRHPAMCRSFKATDAGGRTQQSALCLVLSGLMGILVAYAMLWHGDLPLR